LDAVLLSTPDYDSSLRLATKAYHVFKYADRPVLQFQCQVTLCLKLDGGCNGITPPKCPETKPHHLLRQRKRLLRKSRAAAHLEQHASEGTFDLFTKSLMVVDEEFADLADCQMFSKKGDNFLSYWGSPGLPMVLLTGLTLLNLIVAGSTLGYWAQRRFKGSFHVK
jgi:hypothetical protein